MGDWHIDEIEIDGLEAYLVTPFQPNGSAVIFLHWFDEAPNANRSQFLDEATDLAQRGVTSLLPQLTFPWHAPPSDTDNDLRRITGEMGRLRAACEHLVGIGSVEESRVVMVGHDFGAMHGMGVFGEVDLVGAVLIAPTARWSDWFLRFWEIDSDPWDYMRWLHRVDPVTTVSHANCPLLFQFGKEDFYIAAMTGLELFEAAPEPKELKTYECGHDMGLDQIRVDRTVFIERALDLS